MTSPAAGRLAAAISALAAFAGATAAPAPARATDPAAPAPAAPAPAPAPAAPAPSREAVVALLSAWEPLPHAALVRAIGPRAEQAIAEVAEGRDAPVVARVRALDALGRIATPRARAAIDAAVAETRAGRAGEQALVLRAALAALGRGFGEVPAIAPFLAHESADARYAAARALGLCGGAARAAARAALARRLPGEPSARVRRALRAALAR